MKFWDSSALIPLVVGQPGSALCDRWLDEDASMAIWTLTPVEVSSALQRLVRERVLAEPVAEEAERRSGELTRACHVIVDVEHVKSQAQRLLRLHALRAADALQLAAALEWSGGRPAGRTVHTFDTRLAAAARREGFTVPHGS
jgi:uncharacterized protein